jgi:hypothetical protein
MEMCAVSKRNWEKAIKSGGSQQRNKKSADLYRVTKLQRSAQIKAVAMHPLLPAPAGLCRSERPSEAEAQI